MIISKFQTRMSGCFYSIIIGFVFFTVFDFSPVSAQDTRGISLTDTTVVEITQDIEPINFKKSYALLIGASEYKNPAWQDLTSIPGELDRLQEALELYGFIVTRASNPLSRDLPSLIDTYLRKHGADSDNRVLVWFSGHGYTVPDARNVEIGYILPIDAPDPNDDINKFTSKALSMSVLNLYARELNCRHALFVFDSCFSGSIFASRSLKRKIHPYDWASWNKNVRQFMSAGGAKDEVPQVSDFARDFVAALTTGLVDANDNSDGALTISEIKKYIDMEFRNNNSSQNPQLGRNLTPGWEGEFYFVLKGAEKKDACFSTKTRAVDSFPSALIRTVKERNDSPYWFEIEMESDCQKNLHLEYSFSVHCGPEKLNPKPQKLTLFYGQNNVANIPPFQGLFTPSDDQSLNLKVYWTVRDDQQTILEQSSKNIDLLPESRYVFNLKDAHGQLVDQDFRLASLVIWSRDASEAIMEAARRIETSRHSAPEADEYLPVDVLWMKSCYDDLFQGQSPIRVLSCPFSFPPPGGMDLRYPSDVLKQRRANSLEAGLLIGALSEPTRNDVGVRPVIVFAPHPHRSYPGHNFLAWRRFVGADWQAINLEKVNQLDFNTNRETATKFFQELMGSNPGMELALENNGVFHAPDKKITAIDLEVARKRFNISVAPSKSTRAKF